MLQSQTVKATLLNTNVKQLHKELLLRYISILYVHSLQRRIDPPTIKTSRLSPFIICTISPSIYHPHGRSSFMCSCEILTQPGAI